MKALERQYQDQWVEGRVVSSGYRECAARYALLRAELEPLPRPFTVFDFGARRAYFSLRLAEDFGASCVALDRETLVEEAVALNPGSSVEAVVRTIEAPEDLREFGTFDVVLALSVLHHLPHRWTEYLDALQAMARQVLVVEVPGSEERVQVRDGDDFGGLPAEAARRGRCIGTAPTVFSATTPSERTMYAIQGTA